MKVNSCEQSALINQMEGKWSEESRPNNDHGCKNMKTNVTIQKGNLKHRKTILKVKISQKYSNHEDKKVKQHSRKPNNKKWQKKMQKKTKEKLIWKRNSDHTEGSVISLGILELHDQIWKWALEVTIK